MSIRRSLFLGAAGLVLAGGVWAFGERYEDMIQEAERHWEADKYVASNQVLDKIIRMYPDRADPYWRKARNNFDILETMPREERPDRDTLIERYREIESLGKRCAELEPQNGSCFLYEAIGMGRRGTTQGILNSLGEIDEFEELLLRAVDLKPAYRANRGKSNSMGDAYNALGQFYRVVPDWRFLQWLFGAKGDLNRSVEFQRKAVELEPERIEYVKELGVSLICRGNKTGNHEDISEGEKYLQMVEDLPVIKPSDVIDKKQVKELLASPGLACGYSRDEQQEVSREAYERKEK
jgi:tetratricopeptide (TPR) repeat protein